MREESEDSSNKAPKDKEEGSLAFLLNSSALVKVMQKLKRLRKYHRKHSLFEGFRMVEKSALQVCWEFPGSASFSRGCVAGVKHLINCLCSSLSRREKGSVNFCSK